MAFAFGLLFVVLRLSMPYRAHASTAGTCSSYLEDHIFWFQKATRSLEISPASDDVAGMVSQVLHQLKKEQYWVLVQRSSGKDFYDMSRETVLALIGAHMPHLSSWKQVELHRTVMTALKTGHTQMSEMDRVLCKKSSDASKASDSNEHNESNSDSCGKVALSGQWQQSPHNAMHNNKTCEAYLVNFTQDNCMLVAESTQADWGNLSFDVIGQEVSLHGCGGKPQFAGNLTDDGKTIVWKDGCTWTRVQHSPWSALRSFIYSPVSLLIIAALIVSGICMLTQVRQLQPLS